MAIKIKIRRNKEMEMYNHPKTFDFDKKSYLRLIYDYLPSYETKEEIQLLLDSLFNVIDDNSQEIVIELLQFVIDYVITSIANQECVKIIIDN